MYLHEKWSDYIVNDVFTQTVNGEKGLKHNLSLGVCQVTLKSLSKGFEWGLFTIWQAKAFVCPHSVEEGTFLL